MGTITIAKILKPQGIKGEVKAEYYLDANDIQSIRNSGSILIDNKEYKVEHCDYRMGYLYIKLFGINDMNTAELLRNKIIDIDKDKLKPLNKGEYYLDDLIGCYLINDNGKKLGKIVDVNNYGASNILVIKDGTEEILCPFLDDIIKSVDIASKQIYINQDKFDEVTNYED